MCCPGPSAIATAPSGTLWVAGREGVLQSIHAPGPRQSSPTAQSRRDHHHAQRVRVRERGWDKMTPRQRTETSRSRVEPAERRPLSDRPRLWPRQALGCRRYQTIGTSHGRSSTSGLSRSVGRAPADIAYGEDQSGSPIAVTARSHRSTQPAWKSPEPSTSAIAFLPVAPAPSGRPRGGCAPLQPPGLLAFRPRADLHEQARRSQRTQLTHQHWRCGTSRRLVTHGRRIAYMRIRRSTGYD
jgi:hypothetical protein